MSLFRTGPFEKLIHEFEPGDVVGIEAEYELYINGEYAYRHGFIYTTVLQRTHEDVVFTIVASEIIDCRLEGIVRHAFGNRALTLYHAGTMRNVYFRPHEHVLLFKGIRRDLANVHLALLASPSEQKN